MDKKRLRSVDLIVKDGVRKNISKGIKKFGLEGAEEKIKEIYKYMPKCKEILLSELYGVWRKRK